MVELFVLTPNKYEEYENIYIYIYIYSLDSII